MLERISLVVGIYGALHTLFPDREQADTWIHRTNHAAGFDGRSASELMAEGQLAGLQAVRAYLERQIGR